MKRFLLGLFYFYYLSLSILEFKSFLSNYLHLSLPKFKKLIKIIAIKILNFRFNESLTFIKFLILR